MGTIFDHELVGDLFGTDEMRAHFDGPALVQDWLDVERALAEAQAEVGVIPWAAGERIAAEAEAPLYDLAHLRRGIADSQHPLVPLIRSLVDRCGEHGKWVHWGATTQDIVDTAAVTRIGAARKPIRRDLDRAIDAAIGLARRHRDTPMAGRTHGQHAVPITLGLKVASWVDELVRARERLDAAADVATVAQLAGAAGTLASLGDDAERVREAFCRRVGLREPDVPWHAARDRVRGLADALGGVGTTAERIATEVVRLQATELGELQEPAGPGHVGSSTMPQKRNPFLSEYLISSARMLRGVVGALSNATVHAHERDMAAWAIEWIALPQALILTGGILDKLARVLEGLIVDERAMQANLALSGGQIMAEAVMMRLAAAVGHERAHQLVTDASRSATADGRSFAELLRSESEITQHLGQDELTDLLDPVRYLGLSGTAVDAFGVAVKRDVRCSCH